MAATGGWRQMMRFLPYLSLMVMLLLFGGIVSQMESSRSRSLSSERALQEVEIDLGGVVAGTPVAEGGLRIRLIDWPSSFGVGAFEIEVLDDLGNQIDNAQVRILTEMHDMFMGVQEQPAIATGDGHYRAEFPIGMTGEWVVEAEITLQSGSVAVARFFFTIE